jgi:hypothetical protein
MFPSRFPPVRKALGDALVMAASYPFLLLYLVCTYSGDVHDMRRAA